MLQLLFPPVTLYSPLNPPHPAFTFVCFFARLMSRGKTCPMESLSTCEASEKETGLERKHCKGKIVCNNTASSNLNLVFSHCFTHLPFNFYLQPVFNILSLTLHVPPFIFVYLIGTTHSCSTRVVYKIIYICSP